MIDSLDVNLTWLNFMPFTRPRPRKYHLSGIESFFRATNSRGASSATSCAGASYSAMSPDIDGLGVPFDPAMLSWPPGPRDSDGVWAKYWYANVNRSTGFQPWKPRTEPLPDRVKPLLDELTAIYEAMNRYRISP